MKFYKYEGCGNDFIIVLYEDIKEYDIVELCRRICHRHYGIGADGLIVLKMNPYEMIYYNKDGSLASMCGNGIRCAAQFLKDHKSINSCDIDILTGDGIKHIHYIQNEIKVHMGNIKDIKITHKIIDCDDQPYDIYLCHIGVNHVIYRTEHFYNVYSLSKDISENLNEEININFVMKMDDGRLKVRTYEKGAGLTLACGTGACASALVYYDLGLTDNCVDVEMLGGTLRIEIADDELYMYGKAHKICEGEYNE